jgi:hypothetical protein
VLECQDVMKNPARHYNCISQLSADQLDADAARSLQPRSTTLVLVVSDSVNQHLSSIADRHRDVYSQEAKDLLQLKREAARLLRQNYVSSP